MADCTLGSSKRARANSRFGWKANCSSTPRPKCSMRRSQVWAWLIYRRAWCNRTSTKVASSGCLRTGALHIRATTSITQAGANPPRPLPCLWTRCGTATELRRFDASAYGVPTVYRERVTDHKTCCGTAKPKHSACDLLGATKSADGYVLQHRVKGVSLSGHHLVEHRSM